jgi:hypothetical protein
MTDFETDEKAQKRMESQAVPEADLQIILKLHRIRLGWSYLLQETLADRMTGFPCENEEFFVRRQLRAAQLKVSEWFKKMSRLYKWPSIDGWMWEIDFASGQAVPQKQRPRVNDIKNQQNKTEVDSFVEGPIMTLGDMDCDIIRRLLEKREAMADSLRSAVRRILNRETSLEELNDTVQRLGAAHIDVNDWFSKMADTYQWPKPKSLRWQYRVDMAEKQVLIERTGEYPL